MNELLGLTIISLGVIFDFFGCVGLIRFPDLYNRLHASNKCVTLGTTMILLGVFVITGISPVGIKALLCIAFIMVTSPTSAHALAKGAHKYGVPLWESSVCDDYARDKKK